MHADKTHVCISKLILVTEVQLLICVTGEALLGALVPGRLFLQQTLKVIHVIVLEELDLRSGQSGSILDSIASCLYKGHPVRTPKMAACHRSKGNI